MSTAIHGSFTINPLYDASPARLFKAFADPISKARWFAGPTGWREIERVFDIRVGGQEIAHGKLPDGPETRFVASYHEIVPDERLVHAYDMYVDGRLISVSLVTVEMLFQGGKTELRITEQGVFFDGQDANDRRREGTEYLCGQIAAHLPD